MQAAPKTAERRRDGSGRVTEHRLSRARRVGWGGNRLQAPRTLDAPRLDEWLAAIDETDRHLQGFGADVDLIVAHGLAPRAAVAALIRATVDDLVADGA